MAQDEVHILSQSIEDKRTKTAVRQLERLIQSALTRITDLASTVSGLGSGGGGVTLPIAMSDVTGLVAALAGKAALAHTHAESDITGLVADLAAKAPLVHTHAESDITGLVADLAARPTGSGTNGKSTRWTGGGLGDGAFSDDGTNVTLAGALTLSPITLGSILFAGTGGLVSQDNSNLFWDNTNKILTATSTTNNSAVIAKNASTTTGPMCLQNTAANGIVDFFALDNLSAVKVSWGYANGSYSESSRAGRAYLWRNASVNFAFARSGNNLDGMLHSTGNWHIGSSTTDPGCKLEVQKANSAAAAINSNTVVNIENSTDCWLTISGPAATNKGILCANPSNNGDGALIYDNPSVPRGWVINAGNVSALSIFSNGNTRIGSTLTDPAVKLQVDGSVSLTGGLTAPQAPGSFTVPTGYFTGLHKRVTLTTSQRITVQGTARLSIRD